MESNWLIGKLAKWAFILQEYDFDILHKAGRVNQNVDGLNWNQNSYEHDTIGAKWHGEVDLEVMPGWHASTCMCTLLGCFKDVPYNNTSGGNSQSDNDEPKGNSALDIHLDLPIMAYP